MNSPHQVPAGAVEAGRLALQEAAAQRPEAWATAVLKAAYPAILADLREKGSREIAEVEFQIQGCEAAGEDASDLHATVNGMRVLLDAITPEGEDS